MDINHISVSRKSVWDQCQQAYKYQYHLKLGSNVEEPAYFLYGKIIHRAAELVVEEKGKRPIGTICNLILSGKIPVEKDYPLVESKNNKSIIKLPQKIELPLDYKKKLSSHLGAIERLNNQIGYENSIIEKEFLLDLEPPNGKFVKGFIDRTIRKDDKFFILDYKTSKKNRWRKNRGNIHKDLQLRIYARVIQKEYNVPASNIKAALYYLEGAELVSTSFTESSLISAEEEMLHTYNQIVNTHENKAWGNVGDHCFRCDYRKICPFYKMV